MRRIVIMTMSSKINGLCVAGIDYDTGEWIRLVSRNNVDGEGAVLRSDIQYEDGTEANIFDIIELDLLPVPSNAQNENYEYDDYYFWNKIGTSSLDYVLNSNILSTSTYIFGNINKSLNEHELTGESLMLAKIDNLKIHVKFSYDKIKHKASFTYNGNYYDDISISDVYIKNNYRNVGTYIIRGSHYAVFSLTGKFEQTGKYYKMLAQLF